jgi:Rrf2 family protein
MHVTARGDYAVRAMLGLAAVYPSTASAQALAQAEDLPRKFLQAVLGDLRRAGLVHAVRGSVGGYVLARRPEEVTVGAVLRAAEGPLAGVRGLRPEQLTYDGAAVHRSQLWVAVRSAVRGVLDEVNLAQLVSGRLPARVRRLTAEQDAWQPR